LFVCLVARRVTGVDNCIEIDLSFDETRPTSAQTGRRKRVSSGERLARDRGRRGDRKWFLRVQRSNGELNAAFQTRK
jgi:hypothetical protein